MANSPIQLPEPKGAEFPKEVTEDLDLSNTVLNSLLPPPPNLISETIEKYKDNKLFEGVFIGSSKSKEKQVENAPVEESDEESDTIESIEEAILEQVAEEEESFEFSEEQEQEIVEQRQKFAQQEDPLIQDPIEESSFLENPLIDHSVMDADEDTIPDVEAESNNQNDEISSANKWSS